MSARFDDTRVVVYQAYPEALGAELAALGRLGGSWRTDRHTRLQTSWRWMTARYACGDRLDRERLLAVSVRRRGFDALLQAALAKDFDPALYASKHAWRLATRYAPVLVEWEPSPDGTEIPRFVLHGPLVRRFAEEWVEGVEDVTALARAERDAAGAAPVEAAYPVPDDVGRRIGLFAAKDAP